jgi:hypothetical protein
MNRMLAVSVIDYAAQATPRRSVFAADPGRSGAGHQRAGDVWGLIYIAFGNRWSGDPVTYTVIAIEHRRVYGYAAVRSSDSRAERDARVPFALMVVLGGLVLERCRPLGVIAPWALWHSRVCAKRSAGCGICCAGRCGQRFRRIPAHSQQPSGRPGPRDVHPQHHGGPVTVFAVLYASCASAPPRRGASSFGQYLHPKSRGHCFRNRDARRSAAEPRGDCTLRRPGRLHLFTESRPPSETVLALNRLRCGGRRSSPTAAR